MQKVKLLTLIQNEWILSETVNDEETTSPIIPMNSEEGDQPLIESTTNENIETSPPYVKAPFEDRSKYEKLQMIYDVSSDESVNENQQSTNQTNENDQRLKKRRRVKHNLPEKLQLVYNKVDKNNIPIVRNFLNDKQPQKSSKTNNNSNSIDYVDSDDSIGSCSDLRANDDNEERVPNDKQLDKLDEKSETISESIKTCSSSAYHAECESMTTHEDDVSRIFTKKKKYIEQVEEETEVEDMIFIGHKYADKPLLLDDELDSETDLNVLKTEVKTDILKEKDDVFAMAPFPTIIHSTHKKRKSRSSNLQTPVTSTPEQLESIQFSSQNSSPNIIPHKSPIETADLVVLDEHREPPVSNLIDFDNSPINTNCIKPKNPFVAATNIYVQSNNIFPNNYSTNYENIFLPQKENELFDKFFVQNKNEFAYSSDNDDDNDEMPFNTLDDKTDIFFQTSTTATSTKHDTKNQSKYRHLNNLDIKPTKKNSQKANKKAFKTKKQQSTTKFTQSAGFSNMSFEDFPSGDDTENNRKSHTPFEVIRDDLNTLDIDKKCNSLKRVHKKTFL